MKNFFTAVLFLVGFLATTTYVMGQIYNDKVDEILAPLNGAINTHHALSATLRNAGDEESKPSQEERYVIMTAPVNAANETHFANDYFSRP